MAIVSRPILIICFLISLVLIPSAQTCSNHTFSAGRVFNYCRDLPVLKAHLHWNYIPFTRRVHIAYRAAQTSTGWIAWAINPMGTGMVGSQAIVAFRNSNGSMNVYTTQINSYSPPMQPKSLSFHVSNISAEYFNNEMTIFAVVGPLKNGNTVNHVWQSGNSVSNNVPQIHATSGPNLLSIGTVDFQSG